MKDFRVHWPPAAWDGSSVTSSSSPLPITMAESATLNVGQWIGADVELQKIGHPARTAMRSNTLPAAPPRISARAHSESRSSRAAFHSMTLTTTTAMAETSTSSAGAPLEGGIVEHAESHAAVLRTHDVEEAGNHAVHVANRRRAFRSSTW